MDEFKFNDALEMACIKMKKMMVQRRVEKEKKHCRLIVMKGDAYTGKTTCADAIARYYRCTLIRFDNILDSLSPAPPNVPPPQVADVIFLTAFTVVLSIVRLQLQMGHTVVFDSSLEDPNHLDQLIQVAEEFKKPRSLSSSSFSSSSSSSLASSSSPRSSRLPNRCRFVIVECRPRETYAWQQKFEKRHRGGETEKWYKPKDWEDVWHSPSIADCDPSEFPDYVCRLIVNTTGYVNLHNLGPATLDLCACPKSHLINFHEWNPKHPIHAELKFQFNVDNVIECGNDNWHLLKEIVTDDANDDDDDFGLGYCRYCQEPISDLPVYQCKRCKLTLHKSCAELEDKTVISPDQLPSFLRFPTNIDIPQEHQYRCNPCQVSSKDFSIHCQMCLWEMHLRSGLVPTVLQHQCHSHSLCFWITSTGNMREYQCVACRLLGSFVGYTCVEGSFIYNLHVALLPLSVRHEHGGHDHCMRLVFGTRKVQDDYLCDECQDTRDPTAWYYDCENCIFASHLHCVYISEGA